MQWIESGYNSSVGHLYICINKDGNAVFAINNPDISYISPFSKGCSFVETDEAVYQIDLSGNVINIYSISDTVKCKTYAEGQIWIEEYNSNFDSANYTYTLYDRNGKEVTKFSVEGTEPVDEIAYCGKEIWNATDYSDGLRAYYCTKSNKWIELPSLSKSVYFYEDTAVMGFVYEDPNKTGIRAKMILMDTNGNLNEVAISAELGWNWDDENFIKDGYCILEEYENYLVSYDISSGEFKVFDNEYAEKLNTKVLPDKLMFTDGVVALPLKGKDGNNYVGLFDTSWNIVGEPIPCSKFDFTEGKLIVSQDVSEEGQDVFHHEVIVYDSTGVQIYNAYKKGYKAVASYKEGIAYVLDENANSFWIDVAQHYLCLIKPSDDIASFSNDWKCVDGNGEYLFDAVNLDQMNIIELKQ